MKSKTLAHLTLCLVALGSFGCYQDEADLKTHSVHLQDEETGAGIHPLNGTASWADKRGFDDFNCDGIVDMIEIENESKKPFIYEYHARLFLGSRSVDQKVVRFQSPKTFKLDVRMKLLSTHIKVDAADVDGDGCADIVFSQYSRGNRKNQLSIQVGLNQDRGQSFHFTNQLFITDSGSEVLLSDSVLSKTDSLYDEHGFFMDGDRAESHDYFRIDWADLNGDSRDDLVVFWRKTTRDFFTLPFYVDSRFEDQIRFKPYEGETLISKKIPINHRLEDIDLEDFNGDGYADLTFIRNYIGHQVSLKFGLNQMPSQNSLQFLFEPTIEFREQDVFDSTRFEKVDTADLDGDGCADYIHAGRSDGEPVFYYRLTQCPKQ